MNGPRGLRRGDSAVGIFHKVEFKANATIKSPTQVQNDFERIIRMIGTPAQPPKPRQKAPGRKLGDIQIKRTRHPIVKKSKNTTVTEKMIA